MIDPLVQTAAKEVGIDIDNFGKIIDNTEAAVAQFTDPYSYLSGNDYGMQIPDM